MKKIVYNWLTIFLFATVFLQCQTEEQPVSPVLNNTLAHDNSATILDQEELTLYPALAYTDRFSFYIKSSGGTLHVEWGDGASENFVFQPDEYQELAHQYAQLGNPVVNITGDLASITSLKLVYNDSDVDAMSVALPYLQAFTSSFNVSPLSIDLSENKNLTSIKVSVTNTKEVIAPHTSTLSYIDVNLPYMTASDFDTLITQVYQNAVEFNILNGEILYEIGDSPSPQALQMLDALQTTYGWTVNPWE